MGVCALLLIAVGIAIADGRQLFFLTYHREPWTWWNLLNFVIACGLLVSMRKRELWRAYPYGTPGFALILVNSVVKVLLPAHPSGLVLIVPSVLGLAGSALLIAEIARWFRQKVKLV
jgi:hypothetical protein